MLLYIYLIKTKNFMKTTNESKKSYENYSTCLNKKRKKYITITYTEKNIVFTIEDIEYKL